MFEFLLKIARPSKARVEAAKRFVYRFTHVELKAESLRHKIQTLQRLPRYKQTTQDNVNNLALYKGQLRQIEGDAIFASFIRAFGRDAIERKGKIGPADWFAGNKQLERAEQIHFRWQKDIFKSNWVMIPIWPVRIHLLRRGFHDVKWHLVFKSYLVFDIMLVRVYLFLNRLLR